MFNKIDRYFNSLYHQKLYKDDLECFLHFIKKNIEKFKITKHPLGFIYIELARFTSTVYRLHIWPKNMRYTQMPNWPIHNHIYNLESFVITGQIQQIEYNIVLDNEGHNKLYSVNYNSKGTIKKDLKQIVKIIETNISNFKQFDCYSFQKDLYHSIQVPQNILSSTFVKSFDIDTLGKPIVVSDEIYNTHDIKYFKDPLDIKMVLHFLDEIILTINSSNKSLKSKEIKEIKGVR